MTQQTQQNETQAQGAATALFTYPAQARQAVEQLKEAGFTEAEIGVAHRSRDAGGRTRHETTADAVEDIGEDAIDGGLLGGAIGVLVGVGALAIPGVGPVIAGGLLSSILGAGAVGAGLGVVGGGIIGALVHHGMSEKQAHFFASGLSAGGTLVTVQAGLRLEKARDILAQAGGVSGAEGEQ